MAAGSGQLAEPEQDHVSSPQVLSGLHSTCGVAQVPSSHCRQIAGISHWQSLPAGGGTSQPQSGMGQPLGISGSGCPLHTAPQTSGHAGLVGSVFGSSGHTHLILPHEPSSLHCTRASAQLCSASSHAWQMSGTAQSDGQLSLAPEGLPPRTPPWSVPTSMCSTVQLVVNKAATPVSWASRNKLWKSRFVMGRS